MKRVTTCVSPACRFTADYAFAICPRCGAPVAPQKSLKGRGWVLVCIGFLLAVGVTILGVLLMPSLLHPHDPRFSPSFGGTLEQGRKAIALFGGIVLFGLIAAINGIYMIRTGRRNTALLILGGVCLAGLLYLLKDTSAAFKD